MQSVETNTEATAKNQSALLSFSKVLILTLPEKSPVLLPGELIFINKEVACGRQKEIAGTPFISQGLANS
ncbi:hypothetical protein FPE53_05375 [Salmonella enterica subsp. enterica]|uniref:Uncharacterized protein n=2 Tax=Salmonella enterica TaxID=28901 RepID=A0A744KDT9_SALER|nr:hypothetical protein [Salmonella enterica subsp. enterica serovar Aqua]ECH1168671.1 hypothetical protein [Salmonella enterica subsp. enterica serovar Aqua]EIK6738942.1 hypothetical protein [Salmonella enterica subsp. enterica serovar Aqua]HAF2609176.1 hypothetical protein [Salmonella enterica]